MPLSDDVYRLSAAVVVTGHDSVRQQPGRRSLAFAGTGGSVVNTVASCHIH